MTEFPKLLCSDITFTEFRNYYKPLLLWLKSEGANKLDDSELDSTAFWRKVANVPHMGQIVVQEDNQVITTKYCELDEKIEAQNMYFLEKRESLNSDDSGFTSDSSEDEMSEIGICEKMERKLFLEDSDIE